MLSSGARTWAIWIVVRVAPIALALVVAACNNKGGGPGY